MKRAASSLTLSFLLFAFVTNIPLAFSDDGEPVLDARGRPVVSGDKYYIKPAIRGPLGGGVKLGQTGDLTCPVTVLQTHLEVENGIAVTFRAHDDKPAADIILTGTPLDIEFTAEIPDCAESPNWLVFDDNDIGATCVGIGGPGNYPGKKTLSGTFVIHRYEFGYKLVFCVSGSGSPPTCSNIGRNHFFGESRLILTGHEAVDFAFVRAGSNSGGNIIRSVA